MDIKYQFAAVKYEKEFRQSRSTTASKIDRTHVKDQRVWVANAEDMAVSILQVFQTLNMINSTIGELHIISRLVQQHVPVPWPRRSRGRLAAQYRHEHNNNVEINMSPLILSIKSLN